MHPASTDGALKGVFCLAVGITADRARVGGRARVGTLAAQEEEKSQQKLEKAKRRGGVELVADTSEPVHVSQLWRAPGGKNGDGEERRRVGPLLRGSGRHLIPVCRALPAGSTCHARQMGHGCTTSRRRPLQPVVLCNLVLCNLVLCNRPP